MKLFNKRITASKTEVRETKKMGRGVFAAKNFKKGEVVEVSPVIVVVNPDVVSSTVLNTYFFEWQKGSSALALGVGSLFNHAEHCNVTYVPVFQEKTIMFVARKNIKEGEQLFVNYGYDPAHGVSITEQNMYRVLKQKYEPVDRSKYRFLSDPPAEERKEPDQAIETKEPEAKEMEQVGRA